ncbi:MAG: SBBP repeat-containing protein [Cyanobacteria bacterium P01_H01_bin.150]
MNKINWVQQFGGVFADAGFGIAADELGNSYITGPFEFNVNFGSTTLTTIGVNDAFVAKLDSSGNFLWAENFTSRSFGSLSFGYGIDSDAVGNTYATGFFSGTVDFGDTSLTSLGVSDAFVSKLDSNGNVIWAEQIGYAGERADFDLDISSDDLGNAYVTGIKDIETETDIFDVSGDSSSVDGQGFISKINSSGDLVWTENFDSTSLSLGRDIVSDAAGNSYVIGNFVDDVTLGSQTFLSSGETDIFLTKLDSDGNIEWSQSFGNTLSDFGNGIGLDQAGNIYITGDFEDSITFGDTTLNSNGENDVFITKLDNSGDILWAQNLGGTSVDFGNNITVDEKDNIYISGNFDDTVTFGDTTFTKNDGFNLDNSFIVKLDTDGNILSAEQLDYSLLDIAAGKGGNIYSTGAFEDTVTIDDTTFTSKGPLDGLVTNIVFEQIDVNPNSVITSDIDGTTVEGIDLTGFATDTVTVDYTISREADFDNQVYFYAVDDITGTVDGVAVGEDDYIEAALSNLVSPVFSTSDDNTESGSFEFEAGSIVVPLIIADGDMTQALNGEADVYFSYLGANTDNGNFDHIKLLNDTTFGFEDLPNGGDQDFNDIVIEINNIA